jgi:hypothetical protein
MSRLSYAWVGIGSVAAALATGCDGGAKASVEKAKTHVETATKLVGTDVGEVRAGLPEGAQHLASLFEQEKPAESDLDAVRKGLSRARNKVQDLRVAKSTFFAVTDAQGTILRNDQEQDSMAGKKLLSSFPGLKPALSGKYVESAGSMPEAAKVKGPDGQWVAAQPITVGGDVKGLYVTGWSWSAYAYRLENGVRSSVRDEHSDKMPLLYVYVVVGDAAYGAPVSPQVNARAILDQKPLSKTESGVFATQLSITGRDFGLAVKRTPELGDDVAVAVLRSET